MTRYYYDNAIDALVMAEKFGVKITDLEGRTYSLDCYFAALEDKDKTKFYIAPKSEGIFEVRVDDIIEREGKPLKIHPDRWCTYDNRDGVLSIEDVRCDDKIIHRNNTSFIMPIREVEGE